MQEKQKQSAESKINTQKTKVIKKAKTLISKLLRQWCNVFKHFHQNNLKLSGKIVAHYNKLLQLILQNETCLALIRSQNKQQTQVRNLSIDDGNMILTTLKKFREKANRGSSEDLLAIQNYIKQKILQKIHSQQQYVVISQIIKTKYLCCQLKPQKKRIYVIQECTGLHIKSERHMIHHTLEQNECQLCHYYISLLVYIYKHLDENRKNIKGIIKLDIKINPLKDKKMEIIQKSLLGISFQKHNGYFFKKLQNDDTYLFKFMEYIFEIIPQLWKIGIYHNDIALRNIAEFNTSIKLIDYRNSFIYFENQAQDNIQTNKKTQRFWKDYYRQKSTKPTRHLSEFSIFENQNGSYWDKYIKQSNKKGRSEQHFVEFMKKSLRIIQCQQLSTLILQIVFRDDYMKVKHQIQRGKNGIIQIFQKWPHPSQQLQSKISKNYDFLINIVVSLSKVANDNDEEIINTIIKQLKTQSRKCQIDYQQRLFRYLDNQQHIKSQITKFQPQQMLIQSTMQNDDQQQQGGEKIDFIWDIQQQQSMNLIENYGTADNSVDLT